MAKSEEQEIYEKKNCRNDAEDCKILCEKSLFCDARTDTDLKTPNISDVFYV